MTRTEVNPAAAFFFLSPFLAHLVAFCCSLPARPVCLVVLLGVPFLVLLFIACLGQSDVKIPFNLCRGQVSYNPNNRDAMLCDVMCDVDADCLVGNKSPVRFGSVRANLAWSVLRWRATAGATMCYC